MKRLIISMSFLVSVFLLMTSFAEAVPNLISYQGVLNDASGNPVNNTSLEMTFSIYDVSEGGTALWSEVQSVEVLKGVFNVKLGEVETLPSTLFRKESLWLGIKVGTDSEMAPRQKITSGSYAFRADRADMAEDVEKVIVPVGAIIAWIKSTSGTPDLPDGWVECNGQTLNYPESPYNGQTMPDLNTQSRFLMGGTTSGGTGGSASHSHDRGASAGLYHGFNATSVSLKYTDTKNHLPPFYKVVWIVKVK